jgi:hypothetical protein
MTGEYTFVAPERQNELTRRIQQRLVAAGKKITAEAAINRRQPCSKRRLWPQRWFNRKGC